MTKTVKYYEIKVYFCKPLLLLKTKELNSNNDWEGTKTTSHIHVYIRNTNINTMVNILYFDIYFSC